MTPLDSSTSTADPVRKIALIISHVLSPIVLATLLLLLSPVRDASISWIEALVAGMFTTIIPWMILAVANIRGKVTDMHVTVRAQRHRIYAMTASMIVLGLLVLWLMNSGVGIFREVLCILLGLATVAAINLWWKVSVHLAVGSYVILQAVGHQVELIPVVLLFIAILSWSRIRSYQHTATQVCGGVAVGVVIHYAHQGLALIMN